MDMNLTGKILIAMPALEEPTFAHSVIFLCAHSRDGAMGLIINKPMAGMSFMELADRIDLSKTPSRIAERLMQMPVLTGGPVEQQRGFVLHSTEYPGGDGSLKVSDHFALTATTDILNDMAHGRGPARCLLALGYAGWSPGQLENEILHNGWLHGDAMPELVFSESHTDKYHTAMKQLGIDPRMLSASAGHA
jgi:putative transcriptional regulator